MPASLYLHIPFCPSICPYCDFHKMRRHEGLLKAYLARLEQEALALFEGFPTTLNTIYFGGGTPSHLSDDELALIISIFERTWGWPARDETTLEADPLTFDMARLQGFKDLGFSRLSIGLQSTQDPILKFLGRQHSARQGLAAVDMALEADFAVSADLITAVEGQDSARDLHTLAQTGVGHISVYNLTIEAHTPFARRGVRVDEDKELADYLLTDEVLSSYGFTRYEVSNHAKAGCESQHNQVYWQGEYFLALGPSAASFLPTDKPGLIGVRQVNPVIKAWLAGQSAEIIPINQQAYVEDCLMTGLRTRKGLDVHRLEQRSSINILKQYQDKIDGLQEAGLLELREQHLRTTGRGLIQLNQVLKQLLS